MRQSHSEEFNQKLYNVIRQSSQSCVVPSFDGLAERIKQGETVESFDRFFADDSDGNASAKTRKMRGRLLVTAAAAVLLVVSGTVVSNMLNAGAFDSASASAEAVGYEEYALDTDADSTEAGEIWEDREDKADSTMEWQRDVAAEPSTDDCAEVILSVGRKLLISLDEPAEAANDEI